ncbi:MAG TPA: thioesterase family protein [Gammaproteobacteria bacterium]|nr:thioesterase family protein [Gammaproteobacteria bacterium]
MKNAQPEVAGARRARRRTLADKALIIASTDVEIPFQDVDSVEIAWHGNYFRYFEAARAVLLRKIDYDYPQMRDSNYAWPLTEAHVRFVRPLRYGQVVRVWAGLVEWENRMKVEYSVEDPGTGSRLSSGYTVQCAVTLDTWELQLVSPPALLERLKSYL